jgi:hypothetical protein
MTTITIGQLIAALHDAYEREYDDDALARVATEVTVNDLLAKRERERRRSATTVPMRVRRAA